MARLARPEQVILYADSYGFEPFTDWLYGPRDVMGRKRILVLFQEYARDGDTEFSKKLLQHPHKRPMADMFPLG